MKLIYRTDTVALPVSPNHHSQIYTDLSSNDDADIDIIKQTKSALISKGDYVDYDDIFARLVIEKPDEFKGELLNLINLMSIVLCLKKFVSNNFKFSITDHTLSDHIAALAWNDTALSKSIERSLYHGKHVTFCRTREDKVPQVGKF